MFPVSFGANSPISGGDAAPSSATSDARSTFDNSGWTVATGSAKATGAPSGSVPWAMLIIGAVVALAVWKLA